MQRVQHYAIDFAFSFATKDKGSVVFERSRTGSYSNIDERVLFGFLPSTNSSTSTQSQTSALKFPLPFLISKVKKDSTA